MPLPQSLHDELAVICKQYKGEDSTQVVAYMDQILAACRKHNKTNTRHLKALQLGIHPDQRDGQGVHAGRAQTRISSIKASGFSWAAIQPNLIGVEDHPTKCHIASKTMQQIATDNRYAKYVSSDIVGGALGAGHAIHGAAQVIQEMPCTISNISENGKMSKSKCYKDLKLKAFIEDGFDIEMIHWHVEEEFPLVPKIIQSALNTITQVAEGENWPQLLVKIMEEAKGHNVGSIPWVQIKKQVAKSQPPRVGDVGDLADFCKMYGGFPTGLFIHDLTQLCLINMPSDRIVVGQFFKWLLDIKFPHDIIPSHFVNAVVYAHAVSNHAVQDNFARAITKAEIGQFINKMKDVKQSEHILCNARSLIEEAKKNNPDRVKELMDISSTIKQEVVWATIARKNREDVRTLQEIAEDFLRRLQEMLQDGHAVSHESGADSSGLASDITQNTLAYSDNGVALDTGKLILSNKGFMVNGHVVEIKGVSINQWLVHDIDENGDVGLKKLSRFGAVESVDATPEIVSLEAFLKRFKVADKTITFNKKYPANDASKSKDLDDAYNKALVMACTKRLNDVTPAPNVAVMEEPRIGVFAMSDYAAEGLTMVPITSSIAVENPSKPMGLKSYAATLSESSSRFTLNPQHNTDTFVCAMWSVKVVHDEDHANMAIVDRFMFVKPPVSQQREKSDSMTCQIKCLQNFKDIKAHDELVVYKPKHVLSVADKRMSVSLESKAKKPKSG